MMQLAAFGDANGIRYMAHRDGDDWCITFNGNARYFSVWQDNVKGSLIHAIESASDTKLDKFHGIEFV